jgi:hypothetical protein
MVKLRLPRLASLSEPEVSCLGTGSLDSGTMRPRAGVRVGLTPRRRAGARGPPSPAGTRRGGTAATVCHCHWQPRWGHSECRPACGPRAGSLSATRTEQWRSPGDLGSAIQRRRMPRLTGSLGLGGRRGGEEGGGGLRAPRSQRTLAGRGRGVLALGVRSMALEGGSMIESEPTFFKTNMYNMYKTATHQNTTPKQSGSVSGGLSQHFELAECVL